MENFQKIVLIVASVILILCLVIIGVLLRNRQFNIKFPPEIGNCPDYYTSGPNDTCNNTIGLKVKNPNCSTGNFSTFTGEGANVKKCNWSKQCGVTWDGITNMTPPLC